MRNKDLETAQSIIEMTRMREQVAFINRYLANKLECNQPRSLDVAAVCEEIGISEIHPDLWLITVAAGCYASETVARKQKTEDEPH